MFYANLQEYNTRQLISSKLPRFIWKCFKSNLDWQPCCHVVRSLNHWKWAHVYRAWFVLRMLLGSVIQAIWNPIFSPLLHCRSGNGISVYEIGPYWRYYLFLFLSPAHYLHQLWRDGEILSIVSIYVYAQYDIVIENYSYRLQIPLNATPGKSQVMYFLRDVLWCPFKFKHDISILLFSRIWQTLYIINNTQWRSAGWRKYLSLIFFHTPNTYYRQTSVISHTKSQNLNVSHFVVQLSLQDPLKPDVTSIMKM